MGRADLAPVNPRQGESEIKVRLYCTACHRTHYFRPAEVERLAYAQQVYDHGRRQRCLGEVLRLSYDSKRHPFLFGSVEARIENRRMARVTLP